MAGSGLVWTGDVSLGDWIAPRLGEFGGSVGSVVPGGFPAYARVLHPVQDRHGRRMTWAAVCEVTGCTPHARMQWQAISRARVEDGSGRASSRGRDWDGEDPQEGHLEPAALQGLCQVLADHTGASVECRFALWEGYGWIRGSPSIALLTTSPGLLTSPVAPAFGPEAMKGPRLHHPGGRDYVLFTGPLQAATEMGRWLAPDWFDAQSPNLFWPADRSWCVATEIDLDSTLVGGSSALVDALLADPGLEACRIDTGDTLTIDGDTTDV